MHELVGEKVMQMQTRSVGKISNVTEDNITVEYFDKTVSYCFLQFFLRFS